MKRGVFYTLDAIMAVVLLAIMLSVAFVILSGWGMPQYDETMLSTTGNDMLTVLDVNGTLGDAVLNDNANALQLYLTLLPSHICASISVYDVGAPPSYNRTILGVIVRQGCSNVTSQGVAISTRTFVPTGMGTHLAEAHVWYR